MTIEIKPGPELDRAVAEAVGVPHSTGHESGLCFRTDLDPWEPFAPSADLNAAFEAAEKQGLFDVVSLTRDEFQKSRRWAVEEFVCSKKEMFSVIATGPTAALAICAAILKLKGTEYVRTRNV